MKFVTNFLIGNWCKWKIMWKPVNNELPRNKIVASYSSTATKNGDNSTKFIIPFHHTNIDKTS